MGRQLNTNPQEITVKRKQKDRKTSRWKITRWEPGWEHKGAGRYLLRRLIG